MGGFFLGFFPFSSIYISNIIPTCPTFSLFSQFILPLPFLSPILSQPNRLVVSFRFLFVFPSSFSFSYGFGNSEWVVWFGICVCWLVFCLFILLFGLEGWIGLGGRGGLERGGYVGGWGIGWGDWGVVGEMVTLGERSPCGKYGFLVL